MATRTVGLHGCLGNPLARLEARVALEVALPRFGELRVSGAPARYPSTPNMAVLNHLPVTFTAPPPSEVVPPRAPGRARGTSRCTSSSSRSTPRWPRASPR